MHTYTMHGQPSGPHEMVSWKPSWNGTTPTVKEGKRYRMGEGEIEIGSITLIGFADITPELARESGFLGVLDLLKVAKHGKGDNIYLIRFHYIHPRTRRTTRLSKGTKAS